jgi:hypothetical protein
MTISPPPQNAGKPSGRLPPTVHSTLMKVIEVRNAVRMPTARSTGASVAIRMSSVSRYSGF